MTHTLKFEGPLYLSSKNSVGISTYDITSNMLSGGNNRHYGFDLHTIFSVIKPTWVGF